MASPGRWWEGRPAGCLCLLTFHSHEHRTISKHDLVLGEAGTPQSEGIDCPALSHTSVLVPKGLDDIGALLL